MEKIQSGSISALFLAVWIFLDQADTYIEKLSNKAEKKRERDEKSNKDKTSPTNKQEKDKDHERYERKRKAGFYKEESSEDESDEESKPKNKRRKINNESDFDDESLDEEESEEQSLEEGSESQWDSNCYKCGKQGDLLCCESCPKVAHLKWLKLKVVPENDWYCDQCRFKQVTTRQTRSSRNK